MASADYGSVALGVEAAWPRSASAPWIDPEEARMTAKNDPDTARDAILSADEADASLAAWTLEELEADELGDARWAASDDPGA